ncbi:hypothetical protein HC231_00355 [Brenneria izadpanahii]|uniref:Uncharacterized protein n=1 Tax=Brenneria izadpanahii TaxID=2722756 RepID=A0ABX7UN27_9GAMM|nr:hypothetical protein [Brenneria izadpanahii]QTF06550.1 hypothetical protein HC231_00355 [Brenneria izadpanahii]
MINKPETYFSEHRLADGDAVRYWQLSKITEQRYDVADRPMQGDMDPFFFLSKHKNFIPHTYPCRSDFSEKFAEQRPTPLSECRPERWWLPFGSDRVDLSGFWFRPTRVGAWARTFIQADQHGEALFRLTTCGGAILFANGKEAAWNARYQRNLENSIDVAVPLNKGLNEVVIYFDDLAERDIRFFFQLDYLSGAGASVALPVPIAPERVEKIENMLEGMAFSRSAYFSGDIAIEFAEAAIEDLQVKCKVIGDFISLDEPVVLETAIKKGERRLTLAKTGQIPADFRNFIITLQSGEFSASRNIGVEIWHADQQQAVPATLAERIEEALTTVAESGEMSSVKALARLACGLSGRETDAMLKAVLPSVVDCHDCADFTLVPLLWCRIKYAEEIDPATRQSIDDAILNFRYWMDEPGNDVQWYFSENHALLFHTAAYIAGSFFPHATFVRSGRSGAEQARAGEQRISAWLDHFEQYEMAEWNSAPYFPIDLKGLTALAALADNPVIVKRARHAIERLIEQIARSSHQGILTASQGRSYEHTLRAGRSLELSAIARLLWGKGGYGCRFHVLPQLALLLRDRRISVAPALQEIAVYQGDRALEWRFAQGANRIAKLYHYKTRHIAMGSIANYRWGEWGYQESPLHLRLGDSPEAQIWINHPGETIQAGFGRPSYWGGCGTLPRVQQYRGLAVLDFNIHDGQPDFSHAWLPLENFDQVEIADNRIAVRGGNGMALLLGNKAFELVTQGPTKNCEVRLTGRQHRWVIRLCDDSAITQLSDFTRNFHSLSVSEKDNGDLLINDPLYGQVIFFADGRVQAENRIIDPQTWTIQGESEELK